MIVDPDLSQMTQYASESEGSEKGGTSTDQEGRASKRGREVDDGSPPQRKQGRSESTGDYQRKLEAQAKRAEKEEAKRVHDILNPSKPPELAKTEAKMMSEVELASEYK